jgi:O-antigen ligase
MQERLIHWLALPSGHPQCRLFAVYAALILGALWSAIYFEVWWAIAIPLGFLLVWVAAVDYHRIFFLLMASIPVSMEVTLPGGLGTDLPSEPLMWLLTLIGTVWCIRHYQEISPAYWRHPVTLVLLAHLCWLTVASATSTDFIVSLKFLLAKGWYVVVFYFLAGRILQEEADYRRMIWWFFIPLLATVLIVLFRHGQLGFTFKDVNYVMAPFYRNHVMYACLLAVFMPFIWFGAGWYRRWSAPWWLMALGILILLIGINFAFTRAAYVALVAAVGVYWVMRRRIMKFALAGAMGLFLLFASWVGSSDNWLEFAPDYQRTVTHTRFDNLLEATTKLEDISIMERVYRWVAAVNMIGDKPALGFGPGTFYFNYKNYTVTSFKTYVSDNPERSGIHNYYLMTAVEQGLPGLAFFLGLCFFTLLYGERVYHQCRTDWQRRMAAAATLSFALIALLMLMNDFVETDKIGSLFFMTLAILVNIDLTNRAARTIPRKERDA